MNFRDTLKEILPVAIITIVVTLVYVLLSYILIMEKLPESFFDLWSTWDVEHYVKIAENGYAALTVEGKNIQMVFFPLFPLLIKLFSYVFQNFVVSAVVVSNLSYIAAVYYLYRLVELDFEKEVAFRAVIYISVFPTAYFMHVGYTESLFLALTIGSFYYARLGRWWLCGVLGMLAAATRITGILLIPVLIIEYLAVREFKFRKIRPDILWIGLIGLGLLSYLLINYQVTGDPLYFMEMQRENWNKKLSFPYEGFINAWNITTGKLSLSADTPAIKIKGGVAEILFALLGLSLTIYSFFKLRLSYSIYALLTWLTITSTWLWFSVSRYTLSIFPIFILMALMGRRKWLNYMILITSILLYGLFLSLFVRFRWAF